MSKTLKEIAEQLKASDKKVQLIYAFNAMGKTRLSREFKELFAPDANDGEDGGDQPELTRNKIIYYNAFTEDLFYWDNDLASDTEPKLKIQPNSYTDWLITLLKDLGQDGNIVKYFQRYANNKLTPNFSEDFTEVNFSLERGNNERSGHIKISKGEESNFIWSVFYALLDQVIAIRNVPELTDRETNQFDDLEYVFIDDPVSSLDENHLIQLAVNLGQMIKSSNYANGQGIKFIISTHSPLFYNVLYNELKASSGYILSRMDDGSFELEKKQGDSNKSFSYHLHIKKLIEQAVAQNGVQKFHFALLRNLYEKTANFLEYPSWSDLLPGDKDAYARRIMNFYPHNTLSNEEIAEPTAPEKEMVRLLLENLNNYGYWQQEQQNG
jgi:hypothetical protein